MIDPRPSVLRRFWESDRGLRRLLAILVLILFVVPVLTPAGRVARLAFDLSLTALLVAGITAASESRTIRAALSAIVIVAVALRGLEWLVAWPMLDHLAGASALVSTGILAGVVLVRVFRGGRVTTDRILGAVAVYLLLGLTWAQAYSLIARLAPGAFNGAVPAGGSPYAFFYYSVVTLTTVGYGDITPVHPVARSLAMLEAFTGQLYPAVLLARLVSLEIAGHDSD